MLARVFADATGSIRRPMREGTMLIPEIPGLQGSGLTPRESEVVQLILNQSSNLAISLELNCSVKTVEFHVSNIFRKTHTSSRLELVMKIMRAANGSGHGTPGTPE